MNGESMSKAVVIHAEQVKDINILFNVTQALKKVCDTIFLLCKTGVIDGYKNINYNNSVIESLNCHELESFDTVFTVPYNIVFNYEVILNNFVNCRIIVDKALRLSEVETQTFIKTKSLSIRDETNYSKVSISDCLVVKMENLKNGNISLGSAILPLGVCLYECRDTSGVIITNAKGLMNSSDKIITVNNNVNPQIFFKEQVIKEPLGILFFDYEISLNSNIYDHIKNKKICVVFSNKIVSEYETVVKSDLCLSGIYINKEFYVKNQEYCNNILSGYKSYYTDLIETNDVCYGYAFHTHNEITFINRNIKNSKELFVDCSKVKYNKFFNTCGIMNTNLGLFIKDVSDNHEFDEHLKTFTNIKIYYVNSNSGLSELTNEDISQSELNPDYFNRREIRNNTKIHCVNFHTLVDDKEKQKRSLVLESIKKQVTDSVKFINYSEYPIKNCINIAQPNNDKCSAKVLLNNCRKHSTSENDLLIITNSDCILMDGFYNIDCFQDDILFLYRADIDSQLKLHVYEMPNKIHCTGIDGICIPKKYLDLVYDEMSNVIMGDPKWDNYIYYFLKSKFPNNCKEIVNLFHHEHERSWNIDGKVRKNDIILQNISDKMPLKYNKIEKYDMSLVVYIGNYTRKTVENFFNLLKLQYGSYEVILVEYNNVPEYKHLSDNISNSSKFHIKHAFIEKNDISYINNTFNAFNYGLKYVSQNKVLFMEPNFFIKENTWLNRLSEELNDSDDIITPYDMISNYDYVNLGFGMNKKILNKFNYLQGLHSYKDLISTYEGNSIKFTKLRNVSYIIDSTNFNVKYESSNNFNFHGLSTHDDIFCFTNCFDILRNDLMPNTFISNVRKYNVLETNFSKDGSVSVKVKNESRLHLFLPTPIRCDRCKLKILISGKNVRLYLANTMHVHHIDKNIMDDAEYITIEPKIMKNINFCIENISFISNDDYIIKELKLYV